jgi:hypothetical protein
VSVSNSEVTVAFKKVAIQDSLTLLTNVYMPLKNLGILGLN